MTEQGPTSALRRLAWIRLLLGQAQMIGAVLSLCLLVQTGVNTLTIGSIGVTCLFTTISLLLIGGRKADGL